MCVYVCVCVRIYVRVCVQGRMQICVCLDASKAAPAAENINLESVGCCKAPGCPGNCPLKTFGI